MTFVDSVRILTHKVPPLDLRGRRPEWNLESLPSSGSTIVSPG